MLSAIVERTETKKKSDFGKYLQTGALQQGQFANAIVNFNCFEKFEHICEALNLPLMKRPQVAIFHSTARVLRREHTSFQLRFCFVEYGVSEKHRATFENTTIFI